MATHDLRIGAYLGGGFTQKGAVMGFRARLEHGELVIRSTVRDEGVIGRGPEPLHELLAGLDIAAWHDLHVWHEWPAAGAGGPREGLPRDGVARRAPRAM
jgi:hypothetical protein